MHAPEQTAHIDQHRTKRKSSAKPNRPKPNRPKMGSTKRPFRVIIIGAAVSGLTLAHMLERAGIDYLILERGEAVVFAGGASIGLQANALRIMDQLGVYEDICGTTVPIDVAYHRHPGGPVINGSQFSHELEQRLGYPILFFEREELLQILYGHLPDKSKVLCSHKVIDIQSHPDCAIVVTANGKSFKGDMVVGADGIHSITREIIWRNLRTTEPEVVQKEESAITSDYSCIFGVSVYKSDDVELAPGTSQITYDKNRSLICITTNRDKKFWVFFEKNGKKFTYTDIPRFTTQDSEDMIARNKDFRITKKTSLADLWQRRNKTAIVPLEEVAFTRWYHQRLAILGDAAHKVTPNAGHGGNTAIESATTLANLLYDAKVRNSASGLSSLSYEGLQEIFEHYQSVRMERVTKACTMSAMATRLQAMENVLLKHLGLNIMPLFGEEIEVNASSELLLGGDALKFIPYKGRYGSIPWEGWDPQALVEARSRESLLLRSISTLSPWLVGVIVVARYLQYLPLPFPAVDKLPIECGSDTTLLVQESPLAVLTNCLSLLPFGLIGAVEALRTKNAPLRPGIPLLIFQAVYFSPTVLWACSVLFALAFVRTLSLVPQSYGYTLTVSHATVLTGSLLSSVALACTVSTPLPTIIWPKALPSCTISMNLVVGLCLLCPFVVPLVTAPFRSVSNRMYGHEDLNDVKKAYLVSFFLSAISHFASLTSLWLGASISTERTIFTLTCLFLVIFNCLLNFPTRSRSAVSIIKFVLLAFAFATFLGPGSAAALLWLWREDKVRCRG